MQILPLATSRAGTAAQNGLGQSSLEASRQSALFASLLDSVQAGSAKTDLLSASGTTTQTASTAVATTAGSSDDIINLRMTREDLAGLRDQLKEQGFSDDELAAMDAKVDTESGLTWGEMLKQVEEKVAKTKETSKKEISNVDTVELLGLFGKLGFTAEQSQQMVDALAKGDAKSVLSAIDEKVAGLAADSKTSLTASEVTALGRALSLSDEAQARLTTLLSQSDAASGLSAEGLTSAFASVKKELLAKIGQINQAMTEFRQAASDALDNAWLRQSSKLNAGLHTDDVARKAAQAVAMGAGKETETTGPSASDKPGVNLLGDVPQDGKGVANTGQSAGEKNISSELNNRAGAVAAEQAALTGQGRQAAATGQSVVGEKAAGQGVDGQIVGRQSVDGQGADGQIVGRQSSVGQSVGGQSVGGQSVGGQSVAGQGFAGQSLAGQGVDGQNAGEQSVGHTANKSVAATPQFGLGSQTAENGSNGPGQQTGGFSGQTGQEAVWGELLSKVRAEKTTGQVSTASVGATTATSTMAAMDAVTGSGAGKSAKVFDPALAARAARQVESGILRTVGQDAKQLTLNLSPDELGKLSVTVTVKDKEVKAVIKADNADTAAMLSDQAAKIKQTLEDQGFKVTKLEVQTGIARDNQNAWQNPEQHNEAWAQREALERARSSQNLARNGLTGLAEQPTGFVPTNAMPQAAGLDLFA